MSTHPARAHLEVVRVVSCPARSVMRPDPKQLRHTESPDDRPLTMASALSASLAQMRDRVSLVMRHRLLFYVRSTAHKLRGQRRNLLVMEDSLAESLNLCREWGGGQVFDLGSYRHGYRLINKWQPPRNGRFARIAERRYDPTPFRPRQLQL